MSERILLEKTAAALAGGVDAVLLRERQLDAAHMLALAARLRELTASADAQLFVHTQADIAHAVGADGVHVSRHDIATIPQIRRWLDLQGSPMACSASCHNAAELRRAAEAGADFALLSPVFATASHPGAPALGVDAFRRLAATAGIPVVALGGINMNNRRLLDGYGVAVIRALLEATSPREAACALSLRP